MFRSSYNRRQFLARSSLIALTPCVPAFLSRTVRATELSTDGRILVVLQLSGGNDGINTVVPYADEGYAGNRRELRIATDQLIQLNDHAGLHPALRPAADLFDDGRLAIVQGVGYPNPNRSHEVSMAIWHSTRFDATDHKTFGWIGRALDEGPRPTNGSPHTMLIGDENPPLAIRGRRSTSVALADLRDLQFSGDVNPIAQSADVLSSKQESTSTDDLSTYVRRSMLDAYGTADLLERLLKQDQATAARYPSTQLAERLRLIAQLIKCEFGTPVYYAVQEGYDTHAAQLPAHAQLLRELAGALKAFLDDLKAAQLADRVVVLCFSEFGRRVEENASIGTDHGTAGPVLIAGPHISQPLIGDTPPLTDLEDGDLKSSVDFRQIYASVLEDWLGLASQTALGGSFAKLPILKTS